MKIAIILNGISRNKKTFYNEIHPLVAKEFDVTILETGYAGHAEELANQAVAQQFEIIMAAGGDGTLHQVTNGVLKAESAVLPTIGVIPLGTGNDFARTCSLQHNASQIIALLRGFQPKLTDVGRIICFDMDGKKITRHFINVCSLGMGPEVVRRIVKNSRSGGPALTYYVSIVSTFFSHRPQEIYYKAIGSEWKGRARVIAIANGKSFGNAMYIAPDAKVDDGIFHSFIAGDVALWKFLVYLQKIKGNRKILDPMIHYHTLQGVELKSDTPCLLEADGEIEGLLPAYISILPKKIYFLR